MVAALLLQNVLAQPANLNKLPVPVVCSLCQAAFKFHQDRELRRASMGASSSVQELVATALAIEADCARKVLS